MSLQYVKSKKGRDQLLYKGYLHTKERVFNNKTVWKCAFYHKDHCPGRAHTCNDQVIKYTAHHHCKAAREAKRMERSLKTRTSSSPQLPHQVVSSNPGRLPEAVTTKKLCMQNVKQTIQRLRACLSATRQGMCGLPMTSAVVAKTVPENPSSPVSLIPADLHECSERFKGGILAASPVLCEEPKSSHSVLQASQEAGRQRFRSGIVQPGAIPREILSQMNEAARLWLCPQEREKDEIVDLVVLEQFLAVLPVGLQAWVRAREPNTSREALQLAEAYSGDTELTRAGQEMEKDTVTFEDVSLHFSEEEWVLLNQREKALYWDVMHQNYDNVAWLNGGTDSKREEDPWHETPEPVVELLKKPNPETSWDFEQDVNRENHLERQTRSSLGEECDVLVFISGLKDTARDAELDLEAGSVCCGYGRGDELFSLVSSQKSQREEDAEPVISCGELQGFSEKETLQNPEENVIKEGPNGVERQQSNNLEMEETLIPFRNILREHQDSQPGLETPCMGLDAGDQDESLTLLHDQKVHIADDFEHVGLPEGFICEEDISQASEGDSPPEPLHVYSGTDSPGLTLQHRTNSPEGVNGTGASEKSFIQEWGQSHSLGKGGGEGETILSENGLQELTEDTLLLPTQPALESQTPCPSPEESSEHNRSQPNSQGEDLSEGPSCKRPFIQSSASTTQDDCSDCAGNSCSLSVLIEHRRFDKRRKPCGRRKKADKSVLGAQRCHCVRWKPQKRLHWKNWWGSRKHGYRFSELQMGLRTPPKASPGNIRAQAHEALQMITEMNRTASEAEASSSDSREMKPLQRAPSPSFLDKMATEPIAAQLMAVLKQVAADTAEIKSTISRLHPTITGIQNTLGNLSGSTDDAEHRISDLEFTSRNTKAQLVQHCNDIKAIEAKLVGKAVQTNVIAGLWPSLGIKREMSP